MEPLRLALSNDYTIVLAGLASMLEPYADTVEVLEITTDRTMSQPVDLILYDTFGRLPADDEKLERIVAENDATVVVYSWDTYPPEDAMAHGVAGYIHKGLPPEQLVEAVVAIRRGERQESPPSPVADADATMRSWPGQEAGLSARESEVLGFIARGLSNEQIAQHAYLSINTIKTYIRTGYRKIGVTTRPKPSAGPCKTGSTRASRCPNITLRYEARTSADRQGSVSCRNRSASLS